LQTESKFRIPPPTNDRAWKPHSQLASTEDPMAPPAFLVDISSGSNVLEAVALGREYLDVE
jgi:hypothetical protein